MAQSAMVTWQAEIHEGFFLRIKPKPGGDVPQFLYSSKAHQWNIFKCTRICVVAIWLYLQHYAYQINISSVRVSAICSCLNVVLRNQNKPPNLLVNFHYSDVLHPRPSKKEFLVILKTTGPWKLGWFRRSRDSSVLGRSGPLKVPPSLYRPRLVSSRWLKPCQSPDWSEIYQPLLWLVECKVEVGLCRGFFRLACWKKRKDVWKNCNPQNDYCLVTSPYGNICLYVGNI